MVGGVVGAVMDAVMSGMARSVLAAGRLGGRGRRELEELGMVERVAVGLGHQRVFCEEVL